MFALFVTQTGLLWLLKLIFGAPCRPTAQFLIYKQNYPPASEASREVENLTWRKNLSPPLVYGVKEFVRLSVTNFDLNYLRTGEIVI